MGDRVVLVVGVGNLLCGDDGAGVFAARRVRDAAEHAGIEVREHQGEPTELIDIWEGRCVVVLIDTMRSGASAGTIRRFDASSEPLPVRLAASSSTHAFTLDDAIELARTLHRLPERLTILTVEGCTFEAGALLSGEVEEALPGLADAVLREATELSNADC